MAERRRKDNPDHPDTEAPSAEEISALLTDLAEIFGEPGDTHLPTLLWLAGRGGEQAALAALQLAEQQGDKIAGHPPETLGQGETEILERMMAELALAEPAPKEKPVDSEGTHEGPQSPLGSKDNART